jgi:hypothetical protein
VNLSVEQAVSESVARWLGNAAQPGRACLRMNLPMLDFARFFETLAKVLEHPTDAFAFCAAGFGVDEPGLEAMASRAGLRFAAIATHLQRAATWRNRSDATIVAIARGEPEGGNTLQEFSTASSRELAQVLLR